MWERGNGKGAAYKKNQGKALEKVWSDGLIKENKNLYII
jgi:hypothetical protein